MSLQMACPLKPLGANVIIKLVRLPHIPPLVDDDLSGMLAAFAISPPPARWRLIQPLALVVTRVASERREGRRGLSRSKLGC